MFISETDLFARLRHCWAPTDVGSTLANENRGEGAGRMPGKDVFTYEIRVMFFVIQSACEFGVIVMCDGRTSWDVCGVTVPREIT